MPTRRDVEIDVRALRTVTLDMIEACRRLPSVRALPDEHMPLVYAYLLGIVMQAAGVERHSLADLEPLIDLGFSDCARMLASE